MKFRRKLTYKDFKKYFSNNLLDKDKHGFEKRMMQDAFEEEAFDGLSKLSEGELEQDVDELKKEIIQKTKSKKRIIPLWIKYAASIAILIGISSIFFLNQQIKEINSEKIAQETEFVDNPIIERDKEIIQESVSDASYILLEEKKSQPVIQKKQINNTSKQIKSFEKKESEQTIEEITVSVADISIEKKDTESDSFNFTTNQVSNNNEVAEISKQMGSPDTITSETQLAIINKLSGQVAGVTIDHKSRSAEKRNKKKLRKEPLKEITENQSLTRTITGKIIASEDNSTLLGVSVILEGTDIGAVTNLDGEFTLEIPANQDSENLIASFVGMHTQTIPIEKNQNIDIVMNANLQAIGEVVVTALGISKENKSIGYVSHVDFNQDTLQSLKHNAKPIYPNKISKYKQYIIDNIDYSKLKDFKGFHKIKFSFTVATDGSLQDFNFTEYPDQVFILEITRVIEEGKKWKPATIDDIPTSSIVKLTLKVDIK